MAIIKKDQIYQRWLDDYQELSELYEELKGLQAYLPANKENKALNQFLQTLSPDHVQSLISYYNNLIAGGNQAVWNNKQYFSTRPGQEIPPSRKHFELPLGTTQAHKQKEEAISNNFRAFYQQYYGEEPEEDWIKAAKKLARQLKSSLK